MNFYIIVALVLLYLLYQNYCLAEKYTNYNDNCDMPDMSIRSLECNNTPHFPRGLRPNQIVENKCANSFDGLTPKKGNYMFRVPELKYDGIYSTCKLPPKTYSTNKFLHVPPKCMYGKTIIDQSPCSYDNFMYSRSMNLQENDIDDCCVDSCAR